MAVRSRSPKLFLERAGVRPTYTTPSPVYATFTNPAHVLELDTPLPVPEYQGVTQGDPRPDRGQTGEWPHGTT